MSILQNIFKKLENKYLAILFSTAALIVANYYKPNLWYFLFGILLAYLISDGIKILLIGGGNGIFQIPLINTKTKPEGHAYLWFTLFIILGTLGSIWISNWIYDNFIKNLTSWQAVVIPNLLIAILVFIDLKATFYNRK